MTIRKPIDMAFPLLVLKDYKGRLTSGLGKTVFQTFSGLVNGLPW
jgi:hypothetical protein